MVSQSKPKSKTEFRFQAYGRSNASEVASEVRDLYHDACAHDLSIYSKRIPNYERSRGVFKEQIGLSDVALSRIVEILQDYSIVDADINIKSAAFQKVLGSAIRHGMGQYFTPNPVVELAVDLVRPTPKELILDPFSGSGHFLSQSLEFVEKTYKDSTDHYTMHQFKMFHLHGIEVSAQPGTGL